MQRKTRCGVIGLMPQQLGIDAADFKARQARNPLAIIGAGNKEDLRMAWLWLKAVPWGTLISNAPAVVESARKLLDRKGQQGAARGPGDSSPAALQQRVAELEERQRKMVELIESLAKSNEEMTKALSYLRSRSAFNLKVNIALTVAVIGLALKLVYG
jgi:hypothetical protein